jgi:hypothetical protein
MARSKPVKVKQWDRVEVQWLDAYGPESMLSLKAAMDMEPVLRISLGFCIHITKTKIVIAETDDRACGGSNVCDCASVIPIPWVKKISVLRPVRNT